ncbi:post-transcriptional regulator [Metabacillus sp. GX 13764]|uniref:post-transcriptional regulator n=1 Tax=Metabacillus kandeliae TaxID=2900151 RepID=UPI001E2F8140|nr:post-transcriptional regulator [Metabacillus kandeliae]MCD7032954.1 post-transcriptional regulator [Metabacillus kandeliae]
MEKHPAELYHQHVMPFLKSKLEEFKIIGYNHVTEKQLWDFLTSRKWKTMREPFVHELVRDIMSVKPGDFMNHTTVESFKSAAWFDSPEGKQLLDDLI